MNCFGEMAGTPLRVVVKEWSKDPWTQGCPVSIIAAGSCASHIAELAKPVGNIFFAGTETSTVWSGYMDGAVQSGQRAAKEVFSSLINADTDIQSL